MSSESSIALLNSHEEFYMGGKLQDEHSPLPRLTFLLIILHFPFVSVSSFPYTPCSPSLIHSLNRVLQLEM